MSTNVKFAIKSKTKGRQDTKLQDHILEVSPSTSTFAKAIKIESANKIHKTKHRAKSAIQKARTSLRTRPKQGSIKARHDKASSPYSFLGFPSICQVCCDKPILYQSELNEFITHES